MNFDLTEEQQMLKDSLDRLLINEYGFEKRSEIIRSGQGLDRGIWTMFAEMGLLGFTLPEVYGGFGGSAADTMVVMESLGEKLVVEPYFSTVVLAAGLIQNVANQSQKEEILPAIAGGERLLALAHSEPNARYELDYVETSAFCDGDNFILNGFKTAVLGGGAAGQLIVSARTEGEAKDRNGIALFLVNADAQGVSVHDFASHDGHRIADVNLDMVVVPQSALVGEAGKGFPAIERAIDNGIAALCAEAVGIMGAMISETLEYVKTRKQFGVAIGSFQALQHRLADMFIQTEQARSMAFLAASEAGSTDCQVRRQAISMSKTLIGQAARHVGQEGVQLHGGMGVTDEMFVSHLFKRLTMIDLLLGNTDYHLAHVSDSLLAEAK